MKTGKGAQRSGRHFRGACYLTSRSSENPEYRGRTGKVSPFDGLCNNRLKTVKNVIPCFSSVEGRLWM